MSKGPELTKLKYTQITGWEEKPLASSVASCLVFQISPRSFSYAEGRVLREWAWDLST